MDWLRYFGKHHCGRTKTDDDADLQDSEKDLQTRFILAENGSKMDLDANDGLPPGQSVDQYIASFSIIEPPGGRYIATNPHPDVSSEVVGSFEVLFAQSMQMDSFKEDMIIVEECPGNFQYKRHEWLSSKVLKVYMAPLDTPGEYKFAISSKILTSLGKMMNQYEDSEAGTPEDNCIIEFSILQPGQASASGTSASEAADYVTADNNEISANNSESGGPDGHNINAEMFAASDDDAVEEEGGEE